MSLDNEWFLAGKMAVQRLDDLTLQCTCTFDLDTLHDLLGPLTQTDEFAPSPDELGARTRFYVQAQVPRGAKIPRYSREVDRGDAVVSFRAPLGRYRHTPAPDFETHRTATGSATPYVNRQGILSLYVDRDPEEFARITNDGLSVHGGRLSIQGHIQSRHVDISSAALVIQGRTSDYRAIADVALSYEEEATQENFGLRRYCYSAEYDLGQDVGSTLTQDDNADLFLEVRSRGHEPYKKRISVSRYYVRALTRSGWVKNGDTTLSVVPYYTFKSKSPSLHLELFSPAIHSYLRSAQRHVRPRVTPGSKPIWIVGELPYKAQDNGLAFFKYLRDKHPEIDAYYVIREDSPERRNLTGYDNVLPFRSRGHIDKILAADRIVTSHHAQFIYPTQDPRFERLVRAPKVFLQHGVTAAKWMVPNYGKSTQGFDAQFITVCSDREKEFFVSDFGYSPDEVAVTGFARFDSLLANDIEQRHGQIFVMPTWRPWLQDSETFTESEYFNRWRDLLASSSLHEMLGTHNASIVLCLHPNMQQFSHHFATDKVHVVLQGEIDVQALMKQSSVMITDYSSVAFDFAFLDRPVIYYQFDADKFDTPHADPQLELPGLVTRDQEDVLVELDAIFARDYAQSWEYHDRASRFLKHRDRCNCERIYALVRDLHVERDRITDLTRSETYFTLINLARRSKRYMKVMRVAFRMFQKLPMDPNLIVFESGQGRQYGDSPRYIFEELVRRHDARTKVWIYNGGLPVRDDKTIVVKRMTPEYFWYLAKAKYWVTNHNFPNYIHRRPDGVYIQTWHGTPLKKMFYDQESFFGRDPGYKSRVRESVRQWSTLVSPSPYATTCIRSAYAFEGPVLETGYPRNDILVGDGSRERGNEVRRKLGIASDKKVVLYAPTFRDDRPASRGRFYFDLPFDLEEFAREVGDDCTLLIRTHVLVSNPVVVPEHLRSRIINVSRYPDIQELFLASDVLVTDYSSSFFDYALLGRPIIFYAYDLEKYRDRLRGFYLDYGDNLPGPIVESEHDFFEQVRRFVTQDTRPVDELRSFASEYAPHDDGAAASRVVDELF